MTPDAVKKTLELIAQLWPKADWPSPLQTEFVRRLKGISLSAEQAEAALVNLRAGMKWQSVQPVELLDALDRATPKRTTGSALGSSLEADRALIAKTASEDPQLAWTCYTIIQAEENVPAHWPDTPQAYRTHPPTAIRIAAMIREGLPTTGHEAEVVRRFEAHVKENQHRLTSHWLFQEALMLTTGRNTRGRFPGL